MKPQFRIIFKPRLRLVDVYRLEQGKMVGRRQWHCGSLDAEGYGKTMREAWDAMKENQSSQS